MITEIITSKFKIEGLEDLHKQNEVTEILCSVRGVKEVDIDLEKDIVTVEGKAEIPSLTLALEENGINSTEV